MRARIVSRFRSFSPSFGSICAAATSISRRVYSSELEVADGAVGDQRDDLVHHGRVLRRRVVRLELLPALVVADETVLPPPAGVLASRRRAVAADRPARGRHGLVLQAVEGSDDPLARAGVT